MKFKQSLLLILSISAMLLSANSYAGRQGFNFFYGIGGGIVAPQSEGLDEDPVAAVSAIIGVEEDGWSLEFTGFQTTEGSESSFYDYSLNGSDIGISYRSIEKNGKYHKFKISNAKIDYESVETATNVTDTVEDIRGRSYTFGLGWRVSRENRVEVDYTYHIVKDSDFDDVVHFVNISYLWGGAPYLGKDF